MQINKVQSNINPSFNAKLKIYDPYKIYSGQGNYAERAKCVHFFSSKELSEVKKLFAEKTKGIKGELFLSTYDCSNTTGWDFSHIELNRASSKYDIYDSIPISILNCAPPNTKVRHGDYKYNVADKPTFNRALELREEYNERQALLEYTKNKPRLSDDSELVQRFNKLIKMQEADPNNMTLGAEIYKVNCQIVDAEVQLAKKLNPTPIGRKPKTVQTLVTGLVKILKIMDKRDKRINELLQLRDQVVMLQEKIETEGNSKQIERKLAKLEQKIDKIKFQLTVLDNIAVGKIFGTGLSTRDYIPDVARKDIGLYPRKWGDYSYEDVKNFKASSK